MRLIAYLVPALVALGFFLYVLAQFRRDEMRPRRSGGPGAGLEASGRVMKFPQLREGAGIKGKQASASNTFAAGERIPYVETTLPAALVVVPTRTRIASKRKHTPPRRIA